MKTVFTVFGLLLIILGGLFIIDGVLPVRSHNPNPSFLEIILGLGASFVGWIIWQRGKVLRKL
jgi:drug/metabolite transporter (DMT)-like permease